MMRLRTTKVCKISQLKITPFGVERVVLAETEDEPLPLVNGVDERSKPQTSMSPGTLASRIGLAIWILSFSLGWIGCRPSEDEVPVETVSPGARMDIVEALRADLVAERSPSDGGGSVDFDDDPGTATVGVPGAWRFLFEVGSEGIDVGGRIFFQVPPFWGWSTPQVVAPDRAGYTTVTPANPDLELKAATIDSGLLSIDVTDRALEAGDRIVIHYGAGIAGAMPDHYSERRSCFYFGVDGDGDGVRGLLDDQPCVSVDSGEAAQMVLTLPTTAAVGDSIHLVAAILDARANRSPKWDGTLRLEGGPGLILPSEVEFSADDGATKRIEAEVVQTGDFRVSGTTSDGLTAISNPLIVRSPALHLAWADLHGHSGLTDGTGTPGDYFRYARDVAALDIAALTDHDHWGMEPLAVHPELWEEIERETELFNDPGEFVTVLGYEWTNWIHGHRHVLYFSRSGEIYSSVSPEYETPLDLWQALRGKQALTFAHHSAGGPIATNWSYPPDPELEPITEIVSVHGSSEAADSPRVIYSAVQGNFVRDVLERGFEFGFIGSGDSHDGHPGLAHFNSGSGGLAALWIEKLDRESVLTALRGRHCYATNGPRIFLQVSLDGHPMGSTIVLGSGESTSSTLEVIAVGVEPIERLDIVRGGLGVDSVACGAELECRISQTLSRKSLKGYLYVRAVQVDGGAAWSSPYFFE
ncbi:MAG: CehA/McbA family metallohydrolase [Acidobacteriota bacterium]